MPPNSSEENLSQATRKGYIAMIADAERQHGIPAGLLAGVAQQESDFREDVITGKKKSRAGAIGIMQFMPATAREEGVDPLDPQSAIYGAARYLAKLRDQTDSWSGALTSYNWGIGNYKKWIRGERKDIPREARQYASGVLKKAQHFGSLTPEEAPLEAPTPPADLVPSAPISPPSPASNPVPAPAPIDLTPPSPPAPVIDTPFGPREVHPETAEEADLLQELTSSGELGLIGAVPELLSLRDNARTRRLIPGAGDTLDTVLGEILDAV